MILGVSLDASFPRSTADPTLFEGNIAAAGCARKSERPVSSTFLHPLYRDVIRESRFRPLFGIRVGDKSDRSVRSTKLAEKAKRLR
jgi:hypothetical protein